MNVQASRRAKTRPEQSSLVFAISDAFACIGAAHLFRQRPHLIRLLTREPHSHLNEPRLPPLVLIPRLRGAVGFCSLFFAFNHKW